LSAGRERISVGANYVLRLSRWTAASVITFRHRAAHRSISECVQPVTTSPLMNTEEVARRLIALCREQKWEEAQQELFSPDAVSIEPYAMPGFEKETRGLPAIMEKGRKWSQMVEAVHAISVSDPLVAGNAFACTMRMDMTMKGQGRMNMPELCVYNVKDGKIVSEQFFA
jgi:limonene-1,2-epoxide hydrolase